MSDDEVEHRQSALANGYSWCNNFNKTPRVYVEIQVPALLAKALYDNQSSYETELHFQRDAILTVLDQQPPGLTGWWLCAYRGRTGIAPANRLQLIGVLEAPDDAEGGKSTKRKKSPAARQDAATTAAAANASLRQGQQSSSAWDLYDNTGSQPAAVADSPSAVHHSQSPPTSTSSPSLPTQQVNGGASGSNLLLFLGRQPKSVRFNDSQAAGNFGNSAGVGAGGGGGPGGPGTGSGGNGTPDSFYDDLKNLDYAVVPPSGIAAPNYDELPSQAELRAPGAKDDSDYALPPAHPVASTDGDYDYSIGAASPRAAAQTTRILTPPRRPRLQSRPRSRLSRESLSSSSSRSSTESLANSLMTFLLPRLEAAAAAAVKAAASATC
ncbi:hypothetical protein BOX15_Mlig017075g1 [Macrostomum lignano]|uniref:SH3 domain-containing protein n=1 Tax=Macrostomum lignano TaxID=282301 RepID=A0A267DDK6_9PLAT|nr:hypothetical protein BOX15_Mlig017075g1 [Macrostomum lignano]